MREAHVVRPPPSQEGKSVVSAPAVRSAEIEIVSADFGDFVSLLSPFPATNAESGVWSSPEADEPLFLLMNGNHPPTGDFFPAVLTFVLLYVEKDGIGILTLSSSRCCAIPHLPSPSSCVRILVMVMSIVE
jgi:hypothetical protein